MDPPGTISSLSQSFTLLYGILYIHPASAFHTCRTYEQYCEAFASRNLALRFQGTTQSSTATFRSAPIKRVIGLAINVR